LSFIIFISGIWLTVAYNNVSFVNNNTELALPRDSISYFRTFLIATENASNSSL